MGLRLDGKSRSSDLVFICHLYIIICCRHWNEVLRGLAGKTLACYPEDGSSYPQDGWFFFSPFIPLSPSLSSSKNWLWICLYRYFTWTKKWELLDAYRVCCLNNGKVLVPTFKSWVNQRTMKNSYSLLLLPWSDDMYTYQLLFLVYPNLQCFQSKNENKMNLR